MSLEMLLGPEAATALKTKWPDYPFTLQIPGDSPIPRIASPQVLRGFLDAGCAPADYVNVFYQGEGLHPARYSNDDRVLARSVPLLLDQGCTFQMREMNRWHLPLSAVCTAIQRETGFAGYVTAFITPANTQGLDYHWDQYLGIVVQLAGTKTWELFEPKVNAPYRDHSMSTNVWQDKWVTQWKEAGPDLTFEMAAGDVLVLPRGWVHNPHSRNATETSVHLTFVLKERVPLWIAQRVTDSALNDPRFRAIITPFDMTVEMLPRTIEATRALMIDYLQGVDVDALARSVRHASEVETSHTLL